MKDLHFLGVGGCGRKLLFEMVRRGSPDSRAAHLFLDLSDDVDYLYKDLPPGAYTDIKPREFSGGVGRVPMSAEYIAANLFRLFNVPERTLVPRVANIYLHSLGGGTGSGMVPVLIDRAKALSPSTVHIACSVFTEGPALENANHLYTFKRCSERADLMVVLENRAMERLLRREKPGSGKMPLQFINEHIISILDLITAARKPGAYPGLTDFKNYMNHLALDPAYRKGARWLVPVVWPPLGVAVEPGFDRYTPFGWCLRALQEGPLCDGVEMDRVRLAILVIEAPFQDYLARHDLPAEVGKLERYLGLARGSVLTTLVPRSGGLRLCLLLYPPPFRKLRELLTLPDEEMVRAKAGWRHGAERDLKELTLTGEVPAEARPEQAMLRILRTIETADPRRGLGELLQAAAGQG
ncbi:MAG: hypothetical protein QXO51_05495 [Halobacteria archaeon]